jgi:hypothetical protein
VMLFSVVEDEQASSSSWDDIQARQVHKRATLVGELL